MFDKGEEIIYRLCVLKIINGEIPSMKICDDEHTLAFMDIAKDVDGHILVVPKRHISIILTVYPTRKYEQRQKEPPMGKIETIGGFSMPREY